MTSPVQLNLNAQNVDKTIKEQSEISFDDHNAFVLIASKPLVLTNKDHPVPALPSIINIGGKSYPCEAYIETVKGKRMAVFVVYMDSSKTTAWICTAQRANGVIIPQDWIKPLVYCNIENQIKQSKAQEIGQSLNALHIKPRKPKAAKLLYTQRTLALPMGSMAAPFNLQGGLITGVNSSSGGKVYAPLQTDNGSFIVGHPFKKGRWTFQEGDKTIQINAQIYRNNRFWGYCVLDKDKKPIDLHVGSAAAAEGSSATEIIKKAYLAGQFDNRVIRFDAQQQFLNSENAKPVSFVVPALVGNPAKLKGKERIQYIQNLQKRELARAIVAFETTAEKKLSEEKILSGTEAVTVQLPNNRRGGIIFEDAKQKTKLFDEPVPKGANRVFKESAKNAEFADNTLKWLSLGETIINIRGGFSGAGTAFRGRPYTKMPIVKPARLKPTVKTENNPTGTIRPIIQKRGKRIASPKYSPAPPPQILPVINLTSINQTKSSIPAAQNTGLQATSIPHDLAFLKKQVQQAKAEINNQLTNRENYPKELKYERLDENEARLRTFKAEALKQGHKEIAQDIDAFLKQVHSVRFKRAARGSTMSANRNDVQATAAFIKGKVLELEIRINANENLDSILVQAKQFLKELKSSKNINTFVTELRRNPKTKVIADNEKFLVVVSEQLALKKTGTKRNLASGTQSAKPNTLPQWAQSETAIPQNIKNVGSDKIYRANKADLGKMYDYLRTNPKKSIYFRYDNDGDVNSRLYIEKGKVHVQIQTNINEGYKNDRVLTQEDFMRFSDHSDFEGTVYASFTSFPPAWSSERTLIEPRDFPKAENSVYISSSKALETVLHMAWKNSETRSLDKFDTIRLTPKVSYLTKPKSADINNVTQLKENLPDNIYAEYQQRDNWLGFSSAGGNGKVNFSAYISIQPASLSTVTKILRDSLPSMGKDVNRFKVASSEKNAALPANLIVYANNKAGLLKILEVIKSIQKTHPDAFAEHAQSFGQEQVLKGVSYAQSPDIAQLNMPLGSFTITPTVLREKLVMQALKEIRSRSGSYAEFETRVRKLLIENNINPDKPHLNMFERQ